ncbi:MAG TPA: hypothetical protein VMU29_02140 [Smithella sp.]|nr:hypothetical protein [Smithella sp.]
MASKGVAMAIFAALFMFALVPAALLAAFLKRSLSTSLVNHLAPDTPCVLIICHLL